MVNEYGRALLGCNIKPKLGLPAKNHRRPVCECLRARLDLTKDHENTNYQPFVRWRQRFDFVMAAVHKAEAGERKYHYLNLSDPTPDETLKRGGDVLREAANSSPELAAATETWKEIKFEFDTVDKLDVAHK